MLTKLKIDPERSKATDYWGNPAIDGIFAAWRYMEFYEHTGTHMDAPSHLKLGGKSEDQLGWENLVGPLNLVDMRAKVTVF